MTGTGGCLYTFRAATAESNDYGTAGMIAVDGYPDIFSAPFGLVVRAVPGEDNPEPAVRDLHAILADLDAADHRTRKFRELRQELEDEVRARLQPDPGRAAGLAADADRAARRMAPPVPGVTANTGHVLQAVLPGRGPGRWWVLMYREANGERVTWEAEASPDDGTLYYNTGHYHTAGEGAAEEALVDLASRAGVFSALTELSGGLGTREAFAESCREAVAELDGVQGADRARVRTALLEAAGLGASTLTWRRHGQGYRYQITYDRVQCTFTWRREHT